MEITFNGKRALVTGAGKEKSGDVFASLVHERSHAEEGELGSSFRYCMMRYGTVKWKIWIDRIDWTHVHKSIGPVIEFYLTSDGGIGRAIAKKLVECGAETVALSRTQSDLDSLKAEVPGISIVHADLCDLDGTRKIMEQIGPIDLLVNNAAVARCAPFLDVTEEDIDYMFDANFKALFNISQIVAKGMVARGQGGSILNVSSSASLKPLLNHAVYGSAKAAVDMLTKIMALELGPHKIRVNSVNPTVVWTDMSRKYWGDPVKSEPLLSRIPLGKFVEIEDVVNSAIFLLSDKSAMTNGISLPIEGGLATS